VCSIVHGLEHEERPPLLQRRTRLRQQRNQTPRHRRTQAAVAARTAAGARQRIDGRNDTHPGTPDSVEIGDDAPRDAERVRIVLGEMIGDTRQAGVYVAAAQVLGAHHLAGRGLHERRAAEEDRAALVAHDDRLVAHRGDVGAARRAAAHHDRDLRDAGRRALVSASTTRPSAVTFRQPLNPTVVPRCRPKSSNTIMTQ